MKLNPSPLNVHNKWNSYPVCVRFAVRAFCTTTNSENIETVSMIFSWNFPSESSGKSFQKLWKLLNFRKANHSTEILGGKSNRKGISGKKCPKISVYPSQLSSFPII